MGEVQHTLLCTWHVDKNFRKNLTLVNGTVELKSQVYKCIRTLLQETSQEVFYELLPKAIDQLLNNENTKRFGQYFIKEYASRHAMWSYAFRTGCGINTNMKLEAMHRVLKDIYMKGLKGKRLDTLIAILLKMSQRSLFKRLTQLMMEKDTHTLRSIRERHSKGKSLANAENVCSLIDGSFTVNSESNSTLKYSVTISKKDPCNCKLIYPSCNVCLHKYSCSCTDYTISSQFCKHIHAVCIFALQNKNNYHLDSENDACSIINLSQPSLLNKTCKNSFSKNVLLSQLKELQEKIQTNNYSNEEYMSMLQLSKKMLNIINKEQNDQPIKKIKIANNKKREHQPRFNSTFHSTKKKRPFDASKASISKPTGNQIAEIKQILSSDFTKNIPHIHNTFDHNFS